MFGLFALIFAIVMMVKVSSWLLRGIAKIATTDISPSAIADWARK